MKEEEIRKAIDSLGGMTPKARDIFDSLKVFPVRFDDKTQEIVFASAFEPFSPEANKAEQELVSNIAAGKIITFQKVPEEQLLMLFTKYFSQQNIDRIDEIQREISHIDINASEVVRIQETIFTQAVNLHASDIHIEPIRKGGATLVRVRARLSGMLNTILPPFSKDTGFGVIRKFMLDADMAIDKVFAPQNGRIRRIIGGRPFDIRLATIGTMEGPMLVMRLLPESKKLLSLNELGFEKEQISSINRMLIKKGIILTTGPTGSGKTTTQYAILSILNKPEVKIITIEDPPEITLPGIQQIAIKEKAGVTWESALEEVLRLDPDIILIGEIRDRLSAKVALESALTGHLVFATMHVDKIENIVRRFSNFEDVNLLDISQSIVGMIAQRLLKKIYAPKAVRLPAPPSIRAEFAEKGVELGNKLYMMANPKANGDGYRLGYDISENGRVMIAEVVYVNDKMKEAIETGNPRIIREKINEIPGHISLAKHAAMKAEQGLIDIRDAAGEI